jgi:UDP-2-acetamido-3-amino-2,3-dideoxy-glucuronate N-acetyltransferase
LNARADTEVAVVGCGAWGRNLVRNFAELGALGALVDPHAAALGALAEAHGGRPASFEEVLADERIDAVAIATQPSRHATLALAALHAGKHVLVEKPIALDRGEAEAMARLADRLDRRLMVGHVLRYHPAFTCLNELVRTGRLGRIRQIYANRFNLGTVRREEDVLWCLGPHDVSMILALLGAEPTDVQAIGGYHLRDEIADTATVQLRFPDGEQAQITACWMSPVREHRLTVIGSEAMAVFDDTVAWERKLILYPHRVEIAAGEPVAHSADPVPIALEPAEPLRVECAHFLDCVRTGRRPLTDSAESLRVMEVLSRASEAMRLGRPRSGEDPLRSVRVA